MRIISWIIFFLALILGTNMTSANSGTLSTEETLKQLIILVSQYDSRIKYLESENALLKTEMMKAGIKIPLTDYSWAIIATPSVTQTIPAVYLTGILTPPPPPVDQTGALLSWVTGQYGRDVWGFITRIQKDWKDIRKAYKLPENAQIGGYEFVQTGSNDHVFVDIIFGTGTNGIYDAKILYQFEKSEYKRKLIGFFEYSQATTRYTTRSGSNPFAGVPRTFIRDPFFWGALTVPSTATASTPSSSVSIPINTPVSTPTENNQGNTASATPVAYADIEKAYAEKRYLSAISLSNTYLATNSPTYELLRIRYRTYFIIGKYNESLAEIAKIQSLGKLDKQTACDAQVIATYSKDTTLVSKYTALCK